MDRGYHLCRNQYLYGEKQLLMVMIRMQEHIQRPKITKVRRKSTAPTSIFETCTIRAKNKMTNAEHILLVELPTPPWNSLKRPSKYIAQLGRGPARLNSVSQLPKVGSVCGKDGFSKLMDFIQG